MPERFCENDIVRVVAATVCRRGAAGFRFVFLPCRLGALSCDSKGIHHRVSCSSK